MIDPPGTVGTALAVVPTREFVFVVDPACIEALNQLGLFSLVTNLGSVAPPVGIRLLAPIYLEDAAEVKIVHRMGSLVETVTQPIGGGRFIVSKAMRSKDREGLVPKTVQAQRALALLALGAAAEGDGIITANQALLAARYSLLSHHRARVIPVDECVQWVSALGIGHGIFLSASDPEARIPPAIYYPWTHPKSRRLVTWFSRSSLATTDKTLFELLRSALFNRYSFILYTRDMLRFYEMQNDYFARRGLTSVFTLQMGFFITSFYLNVWGMLDHLTAIARQALALDLDERRCGIMSKKFWQLVTTRAPILRKIVKGTRPAQWISQMSDVRHPAAHAAMLLPTSIIQDTPQSQKTDAEVIETLKQVDPTFFDLVDEEGQRVMLPVMIDDWRHRQRKTVGENVVYVPEKRYFRPAVNSLDYDLGMLTGMIDVFLFALFRKHSATA